MHRGIPDHPEFKMMKRGGIGWVVLAMSLVAAGCLQTDPTGQKGDPSGKPDIQDRDLLAGATSSTNWPTDDAHVRVAVTGVADTSLLLRFAVLGERLKISGRIRLYRAGPIPVLDSVPELVFPFEQAESLQISSDRIRALIATDTDTSRISLRVESDSGNCYFFGFDYSRNERRFVHSPFSVLATGSAVMYPDSSYLNGLLDSSLRPNASSPDGNPGLYFYIPGTPRFWEAGPDSTIILGPLPKGVYPVRILSITKSETAQGTNRLETFEAIFTAAGNDPVNHRPLYRVSAGGKLGVTEFKGPLVLRAP